jgi:hypothetical protein
MMLPSGSARPDLWARGARASQALAADRIDVNFGIDSVGALFAGDRFFLCEQRMLAPTSV